MNETLNVAISVIVIILLFILSFVGGCSYSENKKPEIKSVDTIKVITKDTIVQTEFVKVYEKPIDKTAAFKIKIDSLEQLLAAKKDTSTEVEVEIPITTTLYQGKDSLQNTSIEYSAYISGYSTSLDSMMFNVTNIRNDIIVHKETNWKVFGETGLGLNYTDKSIPTFNLGLGVEYSKNKVDLGLSGGFNASYEDQLYPGFYVKISAKYNFYKF